MTLSILSIIKKWIDVGPAVWFSLNSMRVMKDSSKYNSRLCSIRALKRSTHILSEGRHSGRLEKCKPYHI